MYPLLIIVPHQSRRIALFNEALTSLGQSAAKVINYSALETGNDALHNYDDQPIYLKIDSTAECEETERVLLRLGYEAASRTSASTICPDELTKRKFPFGELRYPTQQFLGFRQLMHRLHPVIHSQPNWHSFSNPEQIALMFDKSATHQLYRQHGISVADILENVESFDDLITRIEQHQWREVYIKHCYGSTATGMVALRVHPKHGMVAATTMLSRRNGWFNSLRLLVHRDRRSIAEAVNYLLQEGVHIEQGIPKATMNRMPFDCRVVMIAGQVAFVVVRKSHKPFTNLHLGGERGTYQQLTEVIDIDLLEQAWTCCRKIAILHQQMVIGIDLLFHQNRQSFVILETNAFGDLLPNLTRQGKTVYQWQIERRQQWQWWKEQC